MKKYILMSLFLLMWANRANGQNHQQFWYGKALGGVASFTNDNLPNRYKPNGVSYDLGFGTSVVWAQKIGFAVDFSFAKKNIKDDFFKYSLNYLDFDFLPTVYFNNLKTSIFLGGNAATLLYFTSTNRIPKHEDKFQNTDIRLIAGASHLLFTLSQIEISTEIRINKGFIDLRKEQPFQGKTYNYGGSLGLVFKKQGKQALR